MSNTQKKNVPELRFPEFEGEWEEKQFADFTKINQGLQIAINERKTEYSPELYFYITNEFLRPNSQTKYFIENPPQSVIANKEDILMTRTGNTGKVVTNVFGAFHNNFFKIKFDKNLYDRLFLVEVLNSSKIQNKILSLAGSSTIPDLNHSDFYSISSSYPLLREQQKIGKFFSKLDRQIELEEQKLELLQQQKKGYMQKIFSQELRFKDENGEDYPDWKEKKLGDIIEQSMYGIGASATRFDSKNIYIRITDIDEKSRKLNYQNLTTPDELNNKYKLKRNDILFARTGASTGKSYIHKEEKDIYNYYFAGFLIKFKINEQNSPLFIYQFTLTSKFNKWVKVMSVRSGQPGINSEEYAKLPLVLPNKLEQQKIAKFLDRFDRQIELEKQKIEILQQQKKGLLQSMFI
ncbi:TPA: restriction endonuclease subunit S [Staphylococcus aureus]